VALLLALAAGCAGVNKGSGGGTPSGGGGTGTPAGSGGSGGSGGSAGTTGNAGGSGGVKPPPPLTDFPPDPIFTSTTVPTNAPDLFAGTPRASGAPCIVSPEPGTLMPRNWLRPRFNYNRAADENLYEIKLTVPSFAHPLVVYTGDPTYTLDATVWSGLRLSVNDQAIAVSIRAMTVSATGTQQTAPSPAAMSSFTIAPVDAPGKIVYWANPGGSTDGDGFLRGFGIGEESVIDVLRGTQVSAAARNTTQDSCIGCHTATPDGLGVGFVFGPPTSMIGLDTYFDTIVDLQQTTATFGNVPTYVATAAMTTIRALRGIPAYSKGHWSDQEHVVLLTDAQNQGQLLMVDLGTGAAPVSLARTGDGNGATEPTFSHDGARILYVSSGRGSIHDGRLDTGPADLWTVPYANAAGGTATALSGASDGTNTHYYPAFSPDDSYVAFTYIAGSASSYSNPNAEIFVIDANGGQAKRFKANDPPACMTSAHSPGVTNDWPKWSPEATPASNGKTYYWVTFSSTRTGVPQLYVAPMVVTESDASVDYPALYLWNQPATEHNHTPSWDDYQIPPVP
jgi:hypothetical protein